MGVFLVSTIRDRTALGLPHARGGVSRISAFTAFALVSSPRTWGCFTMMTRTSARIPSSPRTWGCFSQVIVFSPAWQSLPHARGGVSYADKRSWVMTRSSPRTWGCFTLGAGLSGFGIVFPTHVGGAPSRGCPRKPLPHSWGFSRLPLT